MNFFETYKDISDVKKRSAFRNEIVAACKVQVFTFYGWLRRGDVPKWHRQTIAKILNKDVTKLFPNNN